MPLRSFSEAEIALMARRRLERPLLATLWLGALMFGLAEGNAFYVLAGTFAVAVNALAVERRREVYVHRLWVNIAVLAAVAILLLEVHARDVFLPAALAHFMILMQVCKLFERKTNRDYVQMLALSVLTVVAAALFSQAMWFALLLVAYLALGGVLGDDLDDQARAGFGSPGASGVRDHPAERLPRGLERHSRLAGAGRGGQAGGVLATMIAHRRSGLPRRSPARLHRAFPAGRSRARSARPVTAGAAPGPAQKGAPVRQDRDAGDLRRGGRGR